MQNALLETEVTAAILRRQHGDFTIEPIILDSLRDDEVLVKIAGVGLCHTDLVVRDGGIPFPTPAVLGHEGAGIVERIGSNITHVKPGDHVVLTFNSCGSCVSCSQSEPAYCFNFAPLNFSPVRQDGSATLRQKDGALSGNFFGQSSFASHAIAHARNVILVDPEVPVALLGPLACGIQTGAGAVMRSFACPSGSSLLITGGGGVGLSAVLGGVLQNCSTIILVEPHVARRELAIELGATHVIDPAAGPWSDEVISITNGGANFALDTTAIPSVIQSALASLAFRGICGLVGAPKSMETSISLPLGVMGPGRILCGIIEGDSDPATFIPELLAHYRAGRFPFTRLIKTYPFAKINEAVADQEAGRCVKPVLLMDASS